MSRSPDCLFCKIVAGEIPAEMVYSDDLVVAFRDIAPVAPTHVLIVPRHHIDDAAAIELTDSPNLVALLTAAQHVAVIENVADSGYRLVFNVGDAAGNTVPHLHLHLVGGRELEWPPG